MMSVREGERGGGEEGERKEGRGGDVMKYHVPLVRFLKTKNRLRIQ